MGSPTGTASMDRPLECSMDPRLEKSTLFASQSQESISSLVELTKELSFGIMMKVSATTMVQAILETSLRLVYPLTRRLLSQCRQAWAARGRAAAGWEAAAARAAAAAARAAS